MSEGKPITGAQVAGAIAGAFVGGITAMVTCGAAAPAVVPIITQASMAAGGYFGAKNPTATVLSALSILRGGK